ALDVNGQPNSPFVYDLLDAHPKQVPGTLTYAPSPSQLARVDMTFHGGSAQPGGDFRYDFRPYRQSLGAPLQRLDLPGERTDWVSTQPGTAWLERATVESPTVYDSVVDQQNNIRTYVAGSRQAVDFFGPVMAPHNGGAYQIPLAYSTWMDINIQPWSVAN